MNGDFARTPSWHIRRTGFPAAWRRLAFTADRRPVPRDPVRVAFLDTGADLTHPSLAPLLDKGINLVSEGEPPQDDNGHGTHVAGILAAASGKDPWLRGVPLAWTRVDSIRLHPVKIFDQTGFGRIADIVRGIEWCILNGIDIINCSFGTDRESSPSLEAVVEAARQQKIILVGAAGNDGRRGEVDYPGRLPGAIAVSACTRGDRMAPFSSTGPQVDLLAPGAGIIATAPGGGYRKMSGTSMAAPHVSAAAAMLLWLERGIAPEEVRRRLLDTAEWIPALPRTAQGAGLLRADRTVGAKG